MQDLHLGILVKSAVGVMFEDDFAPYSVAVCDLVSDMLRFVAFRKSAQQLLQMPMLAKLPDV